MAEGLSAANGGHNHRQMIVDGYPYEFQHTVTFMWKDREGREHEITEDIEPGEATLGAARTRAIKRGYPGHRGGRWNWFVDDAHRFIVGKRKCPASDCSIHKTGIYA